MDEAECISNEILIKDLETSIELPNQNDETTEVIIIVDQNLSVWSANANTNSLWAEEETLCYFFSSISRTCIERSSYVLVGEVS